MSVLSGLFFLFYIANMVHKWRVDSAILHMRKDLAEIKTQLAGHPTQTESVPAPTAKPAEPVPTVQPAEQNRVVAQTDSTNTDTPAA